MYFIHFIGGITAYYIGSIVLVTVTHTCSCIVRIVQDHYTISEEVRIYMNKSPKIYYQTIGSTTTAVAPEGGNCFTTETSEVCSICLNIHPQIHCIKTVCGHEFGHDCFQKWIQSCPTLHTHCPNCRKYVHSMTKYQHM